MWHWPLILAPQQWMSDVPLLAFSLRVISDAIIYTWLFQNTRGSVLMATLYHGTGNLGSILRSGIDRTWTPWLQCSISVLVALGVVLWYGSNLRREHRQVQVVL